jgi:uncharacterized protein (DUF3084 family)
MEYPRITALVPNGEHFDSTALNEGIWLTTGHFNAIENALESGNSSVSTLTTERDNLQQQLTQARHDAQTSATKAQDDLQARDQQISNLQTEIANLKKGPAGEFTQTTTTQDQVPGQGKTDMSKYRTSFDEEAERYYGKK